MVPTVNPSQTMRLRTGSTGFSCGQFWPVICVACFASPVKRTAATLLHSGIVLNSKTASTSSSSLKLQHDTEGHYPLRPRSEGRDLDKPSTAWFTFNMPACCSKMKRSLTLPDVQCMRLLAKACAHSSPISVCLRLSG
jgi:hypothetical protein